MTAASLQMVLVVTNCRSYRDTRKQMQNIMNKLRKHFNVALAEVGRFEAPGESKLAAVSVGRTRGEVRETLLRVADAIAVHPRTEVLSQTLSEI
jgi:uncharacterized protein YlxP (DUF503 family)